MRSFSRVRISPKEQLSLSSPVAFDRKAWRDEPGLKRYIVSNSRDIPERSITQEHRSAEEQDYCRARWGPCNSLGALARLSLPPSACQAARARTGSLKAAWGCDRDSSWHCRAPGLENGTRMLASSLGAGIPAFEKVALMASPQFPPLPGCRVRGILIRKSLKF